MMSAIKWIESGIITLQVLIQDPAAFFCLFYFPIDNYGSALMNDYRNFPFAVIHVIIADFDRNALVAVIFIAYVSFMLLFGN